MKTFTYRKSIRVINWGCTFDSLLELKYALSIQQDYAYLREHIPIFYDPRTRQPTDYIRDNIRRYTPDFLIRHKRTNEAILVEIKPRAFEQNEQLAMRKEIADNYIRWRKFDWSFKVVFDDEIRLTNSQLLQFDQCVKNIDRSRSKFYLKKLNDRFDCSRPSLLHTAPTNKLIQFVMFGP